MPLDDPKPSAGVAAALAQATTREDASDVTTGVHRGLNRNSVRAKKAAPGLSQK